MQTTSLPHVFALPTTPDVERFRFGALVLWLVRLDEPAAVPCPSDRLDALLSVRPTPPNNDGRRV